VKTAWVRYLSCVGPICCVDVHFSRQPEIGHLAHETFVAQYVPGCKILQQSHTRNMTDWSLWYMFILYISFQGGITHRKYDWLIIVLYVHFKHIFSRWIAKEVILTFIIHSWPLIPDGVHLIVFNVVWKGREARTILMCWPLSKEASAFNL